AIGLVVVNVVRPGDGMQVDVTKLDASKVSQYTQKKLSASELFLDIIPDTFFGALARGDLLPVLCIAILFGFALQKSGERGAPLLDMIERAGHVVFEVIGMIMKLAPFGALGAMAFTVGKYGLGTLGSLAQLMACFYATCLAFVFGVLGSVG